MAHKYLDLESSLTPEDASLLPCSGDSLASLYHTYLSDPPYPAEDVPGAAGGQGHGSNRPKKTSQLNVSQWGGKECVLWARAVCRSSRLDEDSLPLTQIFGALTGPRLVHLKSDQLSQILPHTQVAIFHTQIQTLRKKAKASEYQQPTQDYDHNSYQQSTPQDHSTGYYPTPTIQDYPGHYRPDYQHSYHPRASGDYPKDSLSHSPAPYERKTSGDYPKDYLCPNAPYDPRAIQDYPKDYLSHSPTPYEGKTSVDYPKDYPSPNPYDTRTSGEYPREYLSPNYDSQSYPHLSPGEQGSLGSYLGEDSDPLTDDMLGLDLLGKEVEEEEGQSSLEEEAGSAPLTPGHSSLEKIPTNTRRKKRGPRSWEFLMRLLANPKTNPSLIRWEDEADGTFRLIEPAMVAQLWGSRSENKQDLTYVNFARTLRYYYKSGLLEPVSERQLVYRCGTRALNYLKELEKQKDH